MTIVSATSVLYNIETWSLVKQSLIHFLIMLVTVFPCLVFSNWFPNNTTQDLLKILEIFLVSGIIL
ncbi:DUF3021 family protein [Enterococcus xiangfangensis]|uniref:DUF3021 family protein n=1 Tax=Enterococcus xiangfangensis TaxID=1296537 RepID=UPI003D16C52A